MKKRPNRQPPSALRRLQNAAIMLPNDWNSARDDRAVNHHNFDHRQPDRPDPINCATRLRTAPAANSGHQNQSRASGPGDLGNRRGRGTAPCWFWFPLFLTADASPRRAAPISNDGGVKALDSRPVELGFCVPGTRGGEGRGAPLTASGVCWRTARYRVVGAAGYRVPISTAEQ